MDARILDLNGAATLVVNGRHMPFVSFKPTEHADEALFNDTVQRTVRDMAARGVHCHFVPVYFNWDGPGLYGYGAMDHRIRHVLASDPQAMIIIRIQAASMAPRWWMNEHPDEMLRFGVTEEVDGPAAQHETGATPSLGSRFWDTYALDALKAFAKHVRQQDYRDHIIGYLPCALNSNEWFIRSYDNLRVSDFSPAMAEAFAQHMLEQYGIADARVPDRIDRAKGDMGFLLHPDPRHSRSPVSAFYRFVNERCAEIALNFVRTLRQAHQPDRLVMGLFYGYCMDLANFHWLADSGHLALRQVLDDPDGPDFVSSPLEYFTRNTRERPFGGFCWAQGTAPDSARLVGKAYFAEDDFCPPIADQPLGWSNAGGPREDVELLRRNFAFSLCKGNLQWWYDLNGHWFESAGRLDAIDACARVSQRALQRDRSGVAQVAVFLDEAAPQQVMLDRELQRALFWSNFYESFADIGAPVDLFMLSDLEKIDPARYRVMCFPTAFALNRQMRERIDALKCDQRTLIFSTAAGLIDLENGGFSEAALSRTVGMDVAVRDVLHPMRLSTCADHPLVSGFEDQSFGVHTENAPVFHVEDDQAEPLGYYTTRGPVGLATRQHADWRSVYCAVPGLASRIVRNIAAAAGVHLYSDHPDDIVYANASYLGLYARGAGRRTIKLPSPSKAIECFTGAMHQSDEQGHLQVDLATRTTYLFEILEA